MTLRRKILASVILLTLVNGVVTLFVLETAYLSGSSFNPQEGHSLLAPGLLEVGLTLLLGTICVSYLLFWSIKRQILDPVDEIIAAASRLGAGEPASVTTINRRDEIGQLATAFNQMADNIAESRTHLEDKVRIAAEKIERTQRDLAFAERLAATGRLAAGVAHEINNPLGGVMNAIARLRKGDLPPEKSSEYYALCEEGLKRIQGTVRRILDFSRKRPEAGPVSILVPLRQSLELIRHLLKPGKIELVFNAPDAQPDRGLMVVADTGDLQHVFLNLLMNAIDAMPTGGTLTINVSHTPKWVLVEIVDTGVGMTLDELSASFDYFHTTKPVGKGTGLGLSIAHHIVVGYRGALTLNSRKGEGTSATVELPAMSSTARIGAASFPLPNAVAGRPTTRRVAVRPGEEGA